MKLIMENWRKFVVESESFTGGEGDGSRPNLPGQMDIEQPEAQEMLQNQELGTIRCDFYISGWRLVNKKEDGTLESLARLSDSRESALNRSDDSGDSHVYHRAFKAEASGTGNGQAIYYIVPQGEYDIRIRPVSLDNELGPENDEFNSRFPQGKPLDGGRFTLGSETQYLTVSSDSTR